jgi:hypothetical protein
VNCPFYTSAKGLAEAAAKEALQIFNNLANEPYMPYLKLKLGEWYCWAQRPACKQPAAGEDEPAPAADDTGDAADTEAACGDDAGALFVLN